MVSVSQQAAFDLGQAQLRGFVDRCQVRDQFGAAAEGETVDGGDGRLTHPVLHVAGKTPFRMALGIDVVTGCEGFEVGAGAECETGAAQYDRARTGGLRPAREASPLRTYRAALTALRAFGLFKVMTATPSRVSSNAAGSRDYGADVDHLSKGWGSRSACQH
jgi:hypothetical protein